MALSKNILDIEYSINYQSYDVKTKTDISNISLLNKLNNDQLIIFKQIKNNLNNAKTKIDEHQLLIPKNELSNKYGTHDMYELLNIKLIDKELKSKIKETIFYDKLTDKIYMMNFKYQINTNFKLQNVSNAGLKLTEILNHEKIIDTENIQNNHFKHFGNAEMPGNFIVAVNYYLKTNAPGVIYDWCGNSLLPGVMGPKSEGLPDYYGFYKKYREKWLMDEQKMNGDITDLNNIKYIENYFNNNGKCDLYTSDAGIFLDINDFNDQENIEIKLKLAEVLCALISLKDNGNMIIKIYTFFEKATIDVLIILSNLFKTFKIVKPMTSKPANSENYIIGIGYIGYNHAAKYIDLFTQKISNFDNFGYINNIDNDDIIFFNDILTKIYNKQILFIERNLYYFDKFYNKSSVDFNIIKDIYNIYIKKLVDYYYNKYITDNKLKPIDINDNL